MARLQVSVPYIRGKLPPNLMLSFMLAINIAVVRSIIVETRDRIISTTGNSVELPCHTDAGHATVYWKRGPSFENSTLVVNVFKGAAYPRRPNVRMDVSNYSMWIDDVQMSDAGHYICVVAPSPRLGLPKMSGTWLIFMDVKEFPTTRMAVRNDSSKELATTMAPSTRRKETKAPSTTRKGAKDPPTTMAIHNDSTRELGTTMAPSTTRKETKAPSTTRKAATDTPTINQRTSDLTHTLNSLVSVFGNHQKPDSKMTTNGKSGVYSTLQTSFQQDERESEVLNNLRIPPKGQPIASSNGGNLISVTSCISTVSVGCIAIFLALRFSCFLCEETLLDNKNKSSHKM